jgi:hypothetical protein
MLRLALSIELTPKQLERLIRIVLLLLVWFYR